jgi:ABC-type multidrug transport system ATPase subunit
MHTVERVVQDVIEALQLEHVSDSVIGDEAKRGISGGQRKRVNVGMEMVADPSLLFLDGEGA